LRNAVLVIIIHLIRTLRIAEPAERSIFTIILAEEISTILRIEERM
jgi:hypothetical protein